MPDQFATSFQPSFILKEVPISEVVMGNGY